MFPLFSWKPKMDIQLEYYFSFWVWSHGHSLKMVRLFLGNKWSGNPCMVGRREQLLLNVGNLGVSRWKIFDQGRILARKTYIPRDMMLLLILQLLMCRWERLLEGTRDCVTGIISGPLCNLPPEWTCGSKTWLVLCSCFFGIFSFACRKIAPNFKRENSRNNVTQCTRLPPDLHKIKAQTLEPLHCW